MLKKTITYRDLDGNQVTEEFYFHLTKAELAEMDFVYEDGFRGYLNQILETQDKRAILEILKKIIADSYGVRGADGRQFIKDPEATKAFMSTDAASEILMSFFTDPGAAAEFIKSVLPADLVAKVNFNETTQVELPQPAIEEKPKRIEDYTQDELLEMPHAQFLALLESVRGNNLPKNLLVVAMRRQGETSKE